jgi:hypothetical protein
VSLKENCTPSSHTGQEQALSILEYWETSVRKITKYNHDDDDNYDDDDYYYYDDDDDAAAAAADDDDDNNNNNNNNSSSSVITQPELTAME